MTPPQPTPPTAETMPDLLHFAAALRLVSIDPATNRARFYTLRRQATLWGDTALLCHWGRLGTAGRTRVLPVADHSSADATIARLVRRRLQHGYQVVERQ